MLNCKINGTVHIFFLKKSYLSPRWTKLPQIFFYGSFPIILSCYKWVLSRLGPLHGQNWQNVSKMCLFGRPKPKSLKMTNIAPLPQPNFAKWFWFLTIFHHFLVYLLWWKIAKTHFFCSRWPVETVLCWSFLVILAWDNQKGTFWTHFVNFGHEGAPNVTKITYNMIILWENSHRKKNWGSFVHRGLRYDFLRKKIWTVPLILQFNISRYKISKHTNAIKWKSFIHWFSLFIGFD